MLLNHENCCVNWEGFQKETPLYVAVKACNESCVNVLLSHQADPNILNHMEESPLYQAVLQGSMNMVEKLLRHGGNADQKQYTGDAPLHVAASNGNLGIVKLLLEYGAIQDTVSDFNMTPLFLSARFGHAHVLSYLIGSAKAAGQGYLVDKQAEDGATPLYLSAQNGNSDCVQILLKEGADPHFKTSEKDCEAMPLHAAVQFAHKECVGLLCDVTDIDLCCKCAVGTPLKFAINDQNNGDCLKQLIERGYDINSQSVTYHGLENSIFTRPFQKSCTEFTFLTWTLLSNYHGSTAYPNMVKILLDSGAHVNSTKDTELPPLLAAIIRHVGKDILELLITYGADVEVHHPSVRIIDNMSMALKLALMVKNLTAVRVLLEHNVTPPNPQYSQGREREIMMIFWHRCYQHTGETTSGKARSLWSPKGLKHLSRCKIRRSLGTTKFKERLSQLSTCQPPILPHLMMDYLEYKYELGE
ncbi:unnamed protein product [Owenia fusiformis]|uniref:SOCS box domain-containing protein n=1 Tax=Owenia fusiformis TaxID=6347 RepID=A0A8S4PAF6_OWEFU|nr:unnamed protein product [Owenia fusiformis]